MAVRLKVSGTPFGDWEVGGWKTEQLAREAGSCAPSPAAKTKGKKGPYHKHRRARYEEHKIQSTRVVCGGGPGSCVVLTQQEWKPHHWKGGLGIEKIKLHVPPRTKDNRLPLQHGFDFWKDTRRNTNFGAGIALVGLELNTQTGYSNITKVWWLSTKRCKKNFLWGGGTDPVAAQGPIYSGSRKC